MTGRRSHGRLSALNGVVHQGKKETGYHRQARVENVFFRYKSIIGESLRARSSAGQGSEAVLACNVLNRMRDLGRPASYAIRR